MHGCTLIKNLRGMAFALLALGVWLGTGQIARATAVIPPDFATLVADAQLIFRGEVTATRSEWTGTGPTRTIMTFVTFKVLETIKGAAKEPYILQMLGGTVNGRTLKVTGVPTFKVGDRTLLFVENNGTQFFPVVGIMNGYFKLVKDTATGDEMVFRHDGTKLKSVTQIDQTHNEAMNPTMGLSATSKVSAASSVDTSLKTSDFETEIRKQLTAPK